MVSFFLSRNKNIVVFLFLLFLSISFMSFSSTKFALTFKEVGEAIIFPFRFIVILVWDGVRNIKESFENKNILEQQLASREKELLYYKQLFFQYETLKRENEKFRQMLKYQPLENLEIEAAEIISRDPESNFSSLTINKGRKDGILPGMPVFSYVGEMKGLVGLVSESSLFTAKIKTFRNRDFSVGALLPQLGVHGIAQGLGDNKNLMALLYIDKEINLNLGERIVTSSEGTLFPKDILIGTIAYLDTTDKTRLTHKAYIRPFINLAQIEDIFIIKKVFGKVE